MTVEPPVYRPFAAMAFAATVVAGTPLGVRLLATSQLGAPAAAVEWLLLHAGLQVFGFFGTLIVGVAHHLLPRFSGRPVARTALTPWLAALLGLALVLRLAGTAALPAAAPAGALAHALAFALFAGWVWRTLDPPPLARLRVHLAASSAWLALAALLEGAIRLQALAGGWLVPDPALMRAVSSTALYGGVLGWVLGVLVRAGPMFVPDWQVPPRLLTLLPWTAAVAVALGVAAVGAGPATAPVLARLADLVALGLAATVVVASGTLRRARRALPMLSRGGAESRLFRLAAASVIVGAPAAAVLTLAAGRGLPHHLISDALRHLFTVGFVTTIIVAMVLRLIPVLEGTALPWPHLRTLGLVGLAAAVVLRSAQSLGLAYARSALGVGVALSGLLVWLVLAATGASLMVAMVRSPRSESQ